MNIEIESREGIEERAKEPFPKYTALISVTDKDLEFATLKNKPEHLLQMRFDDICDDDFAQRQETENLQLFSDGQAKEIAAFFRSILGNAELLICQCEYGQSRSAGIVAAIKQYLYGRGIEIFTDERYYPNKQVYKKTLYALQDNGHNDSVCGEGNRALKQRDDIKMRKALENNFSEAIDK